MRQRGGEQVDDPLPGNRNDCRAFTESRVDHACEGAQVTADGSYQGRMIANRPTANNGKWLIVNTEDTSPSDCPGQSAFGGWGEVHIYDNSNPKQPVFLGTFSTSNSRSTRTDGEFTDHNTEVARHNQFFSSWYSDGVVWWTMTDKGSTSQRGQFVPPPINGSPAEIWGVFVDTTHNVILASDITAGLRIIKPKGVNNF